MAIFDKMKTAMAENDARAFADLLHEDFVFVRHQSGSEMNRAEMVAMLDEMVGKGGLKTENHRCIYENGDIMVDHGIMSFPDGSREAVLASHRLKDGKIVRMETGATQLG